MVKTKKKIIIVISAVIVFITFITLGIWFIYDSGKLERAIKAMDIEEKSTVIQVLKYAKDDEEILLDIAKKYMDSEKKTDGAAILWHILQNVNNKSQSAKSLLKDYYKDSNMSAQVDAVKKVSTDFDVTTEYDGTGYGGTDGVYCSDFDDRIRYKISSARAASFSAATGGVYILDSADSCVKFISRDGAKVELVKKDVREFIYFGNYIYSIGLDGKISGSKEITLAEGEKAHNLRTFDHQVMCDIYDSKYNLLRTEILN